MKTAIMVYTFGPLDEDIELEQTDFEVELLTSLLPVVDSLEEFLHIL